MIKKTYLLNLSDIRDLQQFVEAIDTRVVADVDAMVGRYVVDARSVMGMISICKNNITVGIHSCSQLDLEVFEGICKKYEVKEGAGKND